MNQRDALFDLDLMPDPPKKPEGALLCDFKVTRIAKVKMHWNHARGEWDWELPEGISNYYEAIEPKPA